MNTTQTLCDDCGRQIPVEARCDYCGGCAGSQGCCTARDCEDCGRLRHDVGDDGRCKPCAVADHNEYEKTLASIDAALNRAGHKGSYTPKLIGSL